jgi:hypothetical protein
MIAAENDYQFILFGGLALLGSYIMPFIVLQISVIY